MRFEKVLLLSTAALALTVGSVMADNNSAFLLQTGDEHEALVQQTGSDNTAGASGSELTQNGHRNDLDILQSGDNNSVGLGANTVTGAQGVLQTHNGTPGDARRGNILDITQSSDGNIVGSVDQRSSTQGAFTRNSATISQGGVGGNEIDSVRQAKASSTRNVLSATQNGENNLIATISQRSGLGGNGVNTIDVFIDGTDNGRGALSGFAAASGATTSSLLQDGRGNSIDLVINGRPTIPVPDANEFGITQIGLDNTVNTVTLNTKRVNLGIFQNGVNNEVGVSTIDGNDNNVGVIQMQNDNFADYTVAGTGNSFLIDQDGNSNDASVTIDGNNNGDGNVFGDPLAGAALIASGFDASWERGVLRQVGNDNMASLAQIGSGNMFGTLQRGDLNEITGMQNGSVNQAAVVQVGMSNVTSFSQNGAGNNAGIIQ